jgi:hypothetical protein
MPSVVMRWWHCADDCVVSMCWWLCRWLCWSIMMIMLIYWWHCVDVWYVDAVDALMIILMIVLMTVFSVDVVMIVLMCRCIDVMCWWMYWLRWWLYLFVNQLMCSWLVLIRIFRLNYNQFLSFWEHWTPPLTRNPGIGNPLKSVLWRCRCNAQGAQAIEDLQRVFQHNKTVFIWSDWATSNQLKEAC